MATASARQSKGRYKEPPGKYWMCVPQLSSQQQRNFRPRERGLLLIEGLKNKSDVSTLAAKWLALHQLFDKYQEFIPVHTDGSVIKESAAAVCYTILTRRARMSARTHGVADKSGTNGNSPSHLFYQNIWDTKKVGNLYGLPIGFSTSWKHRWEPTTRANNIRSNGLTHGGYWKKTSSDTIVCAGTCWHSRQRISGLVGKIGP